MKNIKEITKQDYARRMDSVLEYIQGHLDEDLPLDLLAQIACFSPFHFHRIFSGMVGESVKAYIRRLRLELAAGRLKQTDAAVTTIAFDAGFEAHESFSRAFRGMFELSPLGFRKASKVDIEEKQIKYWKEINMKATIVTLKEMDVIFVRHTGPYNLCGSAWETLCQWAAPKGLLQPGITMLGLSYDDPEVTPPEKLRYEACLEVTDPVEVDVPIGRKIIKAGSYAMATHFGPYDNLADSYAQLCGQWIPQNGHEIDDRACVEIYQNNPEDTDPADLITDIYIPVR
jgi:AraC family transcriptional regulator